jgi:hypothetical protein
MTAASNRVTEGDAGTCRNSSEHKGGLMAKIIEFRVPENFSKPAKWTSAEVRGRLIAFPTNQQKKSA